MKGKMFKIGMVLLIITALLSANFITVGANLVSYANNNEIAISKTNHENVSFGAYFKTQTGEKTNSANMDINNKDMKIYLKVEVAKEGYFNGEIELENSNFEFTSSGESEILSKIEANKISLNQINAGTSAELEIGIKAKTNQNIDLSLLNMQSTIKIKGTYKDSTQKDITITGTGVANLKLISNANTNNVNNSLEIITNKIGTYNGEEKRIIQVAIKQGLNDNIYPVKSIKTEVNVPDIDGKQPAVEKLVNTNSMSKWEYSYENKIAKIEMLNQPNSENKVLWKKEGNEEIILTYIYDSNANIDEKQITAKETIELYDETTLTGTDKTVSLTTSNQKDSIITVNNTPAKTSIYKGKLYAGGEKQYESKTTLNVNLDKVAKQIYLSEKETEVPTKYNQTTINKEQMINVLGENGKITIKTKLGETIAILSNSSVADENGNIVVNYEKDVTALEYETTKPEKVGKIEFNHTKTIKVINKETLKNKAEITENVSAGYEETNKEIAKATSKIELKETTTEGKIEINKESLSTLVVNKNVEIKATLKSNSEEYDLYKNPTIEIELPADITDIKVNSISKLYGDEFEVISAIKSKENGKKIITIELQGEQKEYKEVGIEGTTIIVNADLTLNNKATSKEENVKMVYTNENVNQYKEGADVGTTQSSKISIVSPKGLITTNNMESLEISTIGEESIVSKILEKNTSAKQVKVESEIINNNEKAIENVNILGNFGTNGKYTINNEEKESNMNITLKSALSIEGIESSKVKVYYSENENATQDIADAQNQWKEEITNTEKTKKYLIVISNMEAAESIKTSYEMEIPENLEYNKQAYQGYKSIYTETTTGTTQEVNATSIELKTGTGPIAEGKLTASVAGKELNKNDEVKANEIIKYNITVQNTGTQDITNAKIVAQIPEGTKLVETSNESAINTAYKTSDIKTKEFAIESLKPSETVTKSYEVMVNSDAKAGTQINEKASIVYGEVTKTTNEIGVVVAKQEEASKLRVTVKNLDNNKLIEGSYAQYYAVVENLTDKELTNVTLTWDIPEELVMKKQKIVNYANQDKWNTLGYDINKDITEVEAKKTATISKIPANGSMVVDATFLVENLTQTAKQISVSATVSYDGNDYRSNGATNTLYETNNCKITMTANSENGYIKAGEGIEYTIKVKNNNGFDLNQVVISDQIPSNLTVKGVKVNGEEKTATNNQNNIAVATSLANNEEKEIQIATVVNYQEDAQNDTKISNVATLNSAENTKIESNEVSHILEQNVGVENNGSSNGLTNKINGTAWIDSNSDGVKDDTETVFGGIQVKLLDVATNKIAKNANNEEIATTTDESGFYTLSNIPNGEYLVIFEYDPSQYILTTYKKEGIEESRNSNVISQKLNITGEEKTYAITDGIKIDNSNVSNINIGLIKSKKFDLKLDKYISKVIVQNQAGTKTYEYNNETLAKVELDAKKVSGTNVVIEYNLVVTNAGELEGYVKNIADYIPSDLTFSSELNKDWYQEGNILKCSSIANEKIAAGESKTIKLTATKTITENNTGLINNTAEITESYNEQGVTDINSTPGNKKQGENDMGQADVIISLKTGTEIMYITLTITIIAIIGVGVYFIRKNLITRGKI